MAPARPISAQLKSPPLSKRTRTAGSKSTAETTRTTRFLFFSFKLDLSHRGLASPNLGRGQAISALAALVMVKTLKERFAAKVRPAEVGKDQLRIGHLPEKKVGNAVLAAGPNHQVERG